MSWWAWLLAGLWIGGGGMSVCLLTVAKQAYDEGYRAGLYRSTRAWRIGRAR